MLSQIAVCDYLCFQMSYKKKGSVVAGELTEREQQYHVQLNLNL